VTVVSFPWKVRSHSFYKTVKSTVVGMTNLHRVSKMSHIWLAITLTHVNGIDIFGRNVTYTVGNQKTLYYVT